MTRGSGICRPPPYQIRLDYVGSPKQHTGMNQIERRHHRGNHGTIKYVCLTIINSLPTNGSGKADELKSHWVKFIVLTNLLRVLSSDWWSE